MRRSSFVSALTLVAFLTAAVAPATAGPASSSTPAPVAPAAAAAPSLRTSIDRAARAATLPVTPVRGTTPVRKAMMQGGGGGGGGMMLMTLIATAAGLAGTYFIVKEMRKQNDEANRAQ